jgi:lipid-A-disaccharide synthase
MTAPIRPILFTAFEPSGDALAAPVIAELRRRRPDRPVLALGGPAMAAAGATLLESTTDHPVMLAGAVAQALAHRRRVQRLRAHLRQHPLAALVPVDSPAANWAICNLVRQDHPAARIVHLVAPQVWAWAAWRVRKLRRLTDRVLCLLPFEVAWLAQHHVPAAFVGHPLFQAIADKLAARQIQPLQLTTPGPTDAGPRLALLPGSRRAEITANWPTMLAACRDLQAKHPGLTAAVAALNPALAHLLQRTAPLTAADRITVHLDRVDDVLQWSTAALVVSGTATLHVAVHRKPMVVLYRVNPLSWHAVGRWIVHTRTFALPNLIASTWDGSPTRPTRHVVPEFVPHLGPPGPIAAALDRLFTDPAAAAEQQALFDRIHTAFADTAFAPTAADAILDMLPA